MEKQVKNENIEKETTIEELLQKKKKDRNTKIILVIIIIILLLLFWLLGYKMGKIGYGEKPVSSNPDDGRISTIKVMQGDLEITKDTELDIFNNIKFDNEKIIAPKSSGSYQFCVSNEVENDIKYAIKFTDAMTNPVNMKYRLKIDNIYIRGNENNYIGIENLNVEEIKVLKDSNNIFTLEWYWEDSDVEDTYVGSQKENQYYTLNLEINADVLE